MNTHKIKTMIYDYIFEFEHQNQRGMSEDEFIEAIPVIYHVIKDTKPEILGKLTKGEFILASQLGYKYQAVPNEMRVQMINDEFANMGS